MNHECTVQYKESEIGLTHDAFVYGVAVTYHILYFQGGSLFFFFIEDWRVVSDYRHTTAITNIYAEPSGRRLIIVDSKGEGYLYNPVSY